MYQDPADNPPVDGPAFEQDEVGTYCVVNPDAMYDGSAWEISNLDDFIVFG